MQRIGFGLGARSRTLYMDRLRSHVAGCREIPPAARTLVVAPHQDDETLGCGGTIAAKRGRGEHVAIVCLGDGATHNAYIAPERMTAMRNAEALEAASVLGVAPGDVRFLGLREGRFHEPKEHAKGVRALARIVRREQPEHVFVTYRHEPHRDHAAAYGIVADALAFAGSRAAVYEYPVWYWCHWPLVPHWGDPVVGTLTHPARGAQAAARVFFDFRYACDVRAFGDVKRAALARYVSQTTKLVDTPEWTTLNDVGGGAWLELMFQDRELFCGSIPRPRAVRRRS